ncbi:MAG: phage tail tape measure protein, partial [Candidatus Aminicenantes bacterium]|nr:phage tail tape measure protein [Candidatus Aminicenantes bacterium]
PDFAAAGQSIETFSSLVGIMASNSKKGEKAGTVLRNVMARLAAPTKEASRILRRLNITTADQEGNFRDVLDIIEDLESGLKG